MARLASTMVRTTRQEGLNGDELRKYAPSVYAEHSHDSRSDRYTYVPTIDIMRSMYREGFVPMEASQSRSRIAGKGAYTKHLVKMRHRASLEKAERYVGMAIPELALINSHDGSSRIHMLGGMHVLACLNGLIVADGPTLEFSVQHTGNIVDRVMANALVIADETVKRMSRIDEMKARLLTPIEEGEFVNAATNLRFEEGILIQGMNHARRHADNNRSLWSTFNRVQENVMKGGLRTYNPANGVRKNSTSRAITSISDNIDINKQLWQLATGYLEKV